MEIRGSQPRHERKLNGPRALAASGLIFISGAIAACGSNNATETQKPTILPTETPAPTMTISPSESPVVTPTPEPTPTPKPIDTIIDAKEHPVTSSSVMEKSIKSAYDQNPKAQILMPTTQVNQRIDNCEKGVDGATANDNLVIRADTCAQLIRKLFLIYEQTGDNNFYMSALDTYNYAISKAGLGPNWKDYIDKYLKENL